MYSVLGEAILDGRLRPGERLRDDTHEFVVHFMANAVRIAAKRCTDDELALRRHLGRWRPFVESPARRTEGYIAFRDAVAARHGTRAESIIRELHGVD